MDSKENSASDGGAAPSLNRDELDTTIYCARRDTLFSTVATVIYLSLAAFFIFGGANLALSNSGLSSIVWGIGTIFTGFVIAALATGVISLPIHSL